MLLDLFEESPSPEIRGTRDTLKTPRDPTPDQPGSPLWVPSVDQKVSPMKTPTTKAGKAQKVSKVMSEFKAGTLNSGSPRGPVVKSRKQAVAIAMSQAGMKKPKK